MKTVILAGGFGTRISEESQFKPKPMLEIGEMPILWHIMKEYSHYGFNDFIICAGYKQHVIKEWFADYFLHTSDVTFDYTSGKNDIIIHNKRVEPWKVTVVDTGLNTMTGGRIKRIKEYVDRRQCAKYFEGKGIWNIKADVVLPCATQNDINLDDAEKIVENGTFAVGEGANMPCTNEAVEYFLEKGVLLAPAKAANAGGVATSALEMSQNSMRLAWTFDEVDKKLHDIMVNIFKDSRDAAKQYGFEGNYVVGANIAGFLKVADAMMAQGLV